MRWFISSSTILTRLLIEVLSPLRDEISFCRSLMVGSLISFFFPMVTPPESELYALLPEDGDLLLLVDALE